MAASRAVWGALPMDLRDSVKASRSAARQIAKVTPGDALTGASTVMPEEPGMTSNVPGMGGYDADMLDLKKRMEDIVFAEGDVNPDGTPRMGPRSPGWDTRPRRRSPTSPSPPHNVHLDGQHLGRGRALASLRCGP